MVWVSLKRRSRPWRLKPEADSDAARDRGEYPSGDDIAGVMNAEVATGDANEQAEPDDTPATE